MWQDRLRPRSPAYRQRLPGLVRALLRDIPLRLAALRARQLPVVRQRSQNIAARDKLPDLLAPAHIQASHNAILW